MEFNQLVEAGLIKDEDMHTKRLIKVSWISVMCLPTRSAAVAVAAAHLMEVAVVVAASAIMWFAPR